MPLSMIFLARAKYFSPHFSFFGAFFLFLRRTFARAAERMFLAVAAMSTSSKFSTTLSVADFIDLQNWFFLVCYRGF